jgi:hypothetical protein
MVIMSSGFRWPTLPLCGVIIQEAQKINRAVAWAGCHCLAASSLVARWQTLLRLPQRVRPAGERGVLFFHCAAHALLRARPPTHNTTERRFLAHVCVHKWFVCLRRRAMRKHLLARTKRLWWWAIVCVCMYGDMHTRLQEQLQNVAMQRVSEKKNSHCICAGVYFHCCCCWDAPFWDGIGLSSVMCSILNYHQNHIQRN